MIETKTKIKNLFKSNINIKNYWKNYKVKRTIQIYSNICDKQNSHIK